VLVFIGFGALIGAAAGPRVSGTLASSARPLKVVLPQSATVAAPTSAGGSASAVAGSEPPSAEPESTPSATPAPETAGTTSVGTHLTAPPNPPSPRSRGQGTSGQSAPAGAAPKLPPVKHVFVIMLSDQPYAAVFGPASPARYLSQTLEQRGELLVRYDAVAHEELANELALLSGQGPTAETAVNCPNYAELAPATPAADEQLVGNGCVYPRSTQTLAGQLAAKHLSWRAYVEGLDKSGGQLGACAHPGLGAADPTATQPTAGEHYSTFRNPFVYFHSIIDSPSCSAGDVGLEQLKSDLASTARTPSFSYIAPDRCEDGNPTPCAPGAPAGLAPADGFLRKVVPEILASRAYKDGGLLIITVDEAPSSGEFADSSSCCGQPQYPNLPASTGGAGRRGGGTVGALLISPFIKAATTSQEPYNHYSLLRSIEDLFGLKHLGFAALPNVTSLEPSTYSAYTPR
jgi:hypothetical protein